MHVHGLTALHGQTAQHVHHTAAHVIDGLLAQRTSGEGAPAGGGHGCDAQRQAGRKQGERRLHGCGKRGEGGGAGDRSVSLAQAQARRTRGGGRGGSGAPLLQARCSAAIAFSGLWRASGAQGPGGREAREPW